MTAPPSTLKKNRKWHVSIKNLPEEVIKDIGKAIRRVARRAPPHGFEIVDVIKELRSDEKQYPSVVFVGTRALIEITNYVLRTKKYTFKRDVDPISECHRMTAFWFPKARLKSKK